MTRKRQVSASRETTNLGLRVLEHQKQCLANAPCPGSVGPCAVLMCPLVGVSGAALVSALLFYWHRRGKGALKLALGVSMPVAMRCPECRTSLSVPSKKLGQAVSCPSCKASFVATPQGTGVAIEKSPPPLPSLPPPSPTAHSAVAAPQSVSVVGNLTCPRCHKQMADDTSLTGQLVQCPHCGIELQLPSAGRPFLLQPETASFGGEGDSPHSLLANARYARHRSGAKSAWGLRIGVALAAAIIMFVVGFLVSQAGKARVAKEAGLRNYAKAPASTRPKQPIRETEAGANAHEHARLTANSSANAKLRKLKPEDAAPADDDKPGQPDALPNWTLYHSESGGFEILLPGQKADSVDSKTCLGQMTQEYKISARSGISIDISWFDLPTEAFRDKPPRMVLNQIIREEIPTIISSASNRDMMIGDNPGVEYLLWEKAAAGGLGKTRFFLVGRRVFTLWADCISDRIKRDSQVDEFLNSFRLYKQPGGADDECAVAIQEWQWANLWPVESMKSESGNSFIVASSSVGVRAAEGLAIQFVVAFGLEPPENRGRLATLITIYADVDDKLQRGLVGLSLDANGEEIKLVSQDKVEKDALGRRCVEYTFIDPYEFVDLLRDATQMTIKAAGESPHQLDQYEIAHIKAFMQEVRNRAKEFGFSLSK